ncbi:MAG: magnesium transporter [Planctomycetota bacterium]
MRNSLLAPELRELLGDGRHDDLRQILGDLHPNDAAHELRGLEDQEIVQALELVPLSLARDMFEYFEPELQEEIVLGAGRGRVKALLEALPSDDRYEFVESLDERVREQLVPLLEKAARVDLLRRDEFEADQVGSFLSTEYCALREGMTADEAIAAIRRQEPSRETIYYAYVLDDEKRLLGFVSLRKLITARHRQTVSELMKSHVVTVGATEDQEEAARLIREYDLLALPVIDDFGRLLGLVTYDDAADIQEEESTEDIERMAGVTGDAPDEGGYLAETVSSQIRRRVPLIAFLAIFNLSTAAVISSYEHGLAFSFLTGMLPIVMATGGMVGTQASSLIIRNLTLGAFEPRQFMAVLWKEVRVTIGMAAILSVIVFAEGMVLGLGDEEVGDRALTASIAMALAMAGHVLGSGTLGVAVPIAARALKIDPALVSTPAVTAIADLFGACVFLAIVLAMV